MKNCFKNKLPLCFAAFALILVLVTPPAAAQPRLLVNANDAPGIDPDANASTFVSLGDGRAFFFATDALHGRDPWVTDGTVGGTFRLVDLAPGDPGADIEFLGTTAEHVYFFLTHTDEVLVELWATDGSTTGTRRLLGGFDLRSPVPQRWVSTEERIFFSARDAGGRTGLWVSDGRPAGTRRLPVPLAHPLGGVAPFASVGDRALFVATTGLGFGTETWVSDGSAAGMRRLPIPSLQGGIPGFFLLGDDLLLFDDTIGSEVTRMWRTDGTPAGTVRLPDFAGRRSGVSAVAGGRGWFFTTQPRNVLWSTDGGEPDLVMELDPNRTVENVVAAGDRVFFALRESFATVVDIWVADATGVRQVAADVGTAGFVAYGDRVAWLDNTALQTTDGTAASTLPRSALCADCISLEIASEVMMPTGPRLLVLGGTLESGSTDAEDHLVLTDGTHDRTRVLIDGEQLFTLGKIGRLLKFAEVAGGLVLTVDDGTHGEELWFSGGSAAGTRLLVNLAPPVADGDSEPHGLIRYDGGFAFLARDADGWAVWTSGGDPASTRLLARLPDTSSEPDVELPPFTQAVTGGGLYVSVRNSFLNGDGELLRVDLASGEVTRLGRALFSRPGDAVVLGPRVLFRFGTGLTVSDGTPEGTDDLFGFQLFFDPSQPVALDATTALFVAERSFASVPSLWRTDGTLDGTEEIFAPRPRFGALVSTPGIAYFGLVVSNQGDPFTEYLELWRSDGTTAGTRRVTRLPEPLNDALGRPEVDLVAVPGGVFLVLETEDAGYQLWSSDGTEAGTRRLLAGGEGAPLTISNPAAFGDRLLFAAADAFHGSEPWVSDGTLAGTRRLGDLWAGANGSEPRGFASFGERAFFAADDGRRRRLWTTDGTPEGTFATDSAVSPAEPLDGGLEILPLADRVIYTATSAGTGDEPWYLPYAGLAAPPAGPLRPPVAPRVDRLETGTRFTLWWIDLSNDEAYFSVEAKTPARADFVEVAQATAFGPTRGFGFVVVDALDPGLPHTFRVRAVNSFGASPPSDEVSGLVTSLPDVCEPSDEHLCLLGDRFLARLFWRDPRSGDSGRATAVPLPGSDRTGTFWFFRPENVETIVKVLDGVGVNQRYWTFAGGLTDLERWLYVADLDNATRRVYHQPAGELCGFGDTAAFAGRPAPSRTAVPLEAAASPLSLLSDRFEITVDWRDPRSGDTGLGVPIPGGDNSGYFWFFNEQNVELVVKVLDGTPVNGKLWFFYGGLSDVEYTIRVRDLVNDVTKSYVHAPGDLCGGADTGAFVP